MNNSICNADCGNCSYGKENHCKGCSESKGCPFGTQCFIFDYINTGGMENYQLFKKQLIDEFNSLNIPGMAVIDELYAVNGAFVNLAYPMPNGQFVRLLDDNGIYLCNQVESLFNDGTASRCFGLVAGIDFLLVSEYGENGAEPQIVMYKRR